VGSRSECGRLACLRWSIPRFTTTEQFYEPGRDALAALWHFATVSGLIPRPEAIAPSQIQLTAVVPRSRAELNKEITKRFFGDGGMGLDEDRGMCVPSEHVVGGHGCRLWWWFW
jgi:hypothetical protein